MSWTYDDVPAPRSRQLLEYAERVGTPLICKVRKPIEINQESLQRLGEQLTATARRVPYKDFLRTISEGLADDRK